MRAIGLLALALLVTWIRADDHGPAVPLDDAAPLTHGLDGRSDLHQRYLYVIRPRVRSYGDNSTLTLSPGRIRM